MTDIVERLRAWNKDSYPHCWEAADEIERLQTANEYAFTELADVRADAARLRAALQDIAEDPYAVDGGAAELARRALEPKL